jgi:hypothetical protein
MGWGSGKRDSLERKVSINRWIKLLLLLNESKSVSNSCIPSEVLSTFEGMSTYVLKSKTRC